MPFLRIAVDIDLTPITDRLDAIEAAGTDVIGGLLITLKAERLNLMYLLRIMQDGNPLIDSDGNEVVWDSVIRTQAQAELTEANRIITALS